MFLSDTVSGDSHAFPVRYRAPKNRIYEITDILIIRISGTNANDLFILPEALEELLPVGVETVFQRNPIFHIRTNHGEYYYMHYSEPIRTKYITITARSTEAFEARIIINGRIVKASVSELVWEFVRRGKNP